MRIPAGARTLLKLTDERSSSRIAAPEQTARRGRTAQDELREATLLEGDAAEAVARLKHEPGKDLSVLGSGELVQSLMRHNLVDECVLLIHPLVLGSGHASSPTAPRLLLSGSSTP